MMVPAFVVHGVAAVVIILAILALLVLGVVTFVRVTARGARRVVQRVEGRNTTDRPQ